MVRRILMASLLVLAAAFLGQRLLAQSITSGDITGTVTDATGAALPNAQLTATNVNTGATQTATSGAQGTYRFAFLPPGNYRVTVTANGFQTSQRANLIVTAGQPTPADFQLAVAASTTTVNVTESPTAIQTENADVSTPYNTEQIADMPNPGGDLTYIAQTAPGVVMNTQSGYGNFSALGMPATSNLFTINGQNFNDPYLNLNNSGASNLMLGFNDISEANVINNAYSAQYGQYAGTQVTYITKSGTNAFHGNAIYMWDGRATNANDFFSNSVGAARPFLNFNQWATDVGGPIWKNHTFFDVDYEGARVVLPTSSNLIHIPSPQFQAATLANLAATGNSAEVPYYQQIFGIYNGAAGAASAAPTNGGGCGSFTALGPGVPCSVAFRTTPPNREREYQWAARVDHNFSDKDHGYIRVFRDNGYQPTYTDALNPIFNAYSPQPQMSGQVSESHAFGASAVNQFNASALFYSAAFLLSNPSGLWRRCSLRSALPERHSHASAARPSNFRRAAAYSSIRFSMTSRR
ncbi:MAG TPA: carboxypeptidase regulatory-like domain-containing protein [Bryobacteraceae bacterium]|nr:carboxypeptidase regulatory-like domain-containing protein [Bryobacteraceae bacterium]